MSASHSSDVSPERAAWRDPVFLALLATALLLRAAPLLWWGWDLDDCTRDECIFRKVADSVVEGNGVGLAPKGWLPAPLFPWVMAWCKSTFGHYGYTKWLHWLATVPMMWAMYAVGFRLSGARSRRTARWATALVAWHPTLIFFVGTLWTETLYATLLVGAVWAVVWAREGGLARALVVGALLGLMVLLRGVATYLSPLFLLALAWPAVCSEARDEEGAGAPDAAAWGGAAVGAWPGLVWAPWAGGARRAGAAACVLLLLVVPYSVSASAKHGGFVISDATLGHVAALGNDVYDPVTFDYMNGQLTGTLYSSTLRNGRRDCPMNLSAVAHDRCELDRVKAWVWDNPGTFLARMPMRVSQVLNPHSFLTRHVRWNLWPTLPWGAKEALVLCNALWSLALMLGGAMLVWRRRAGLVAALTLGAWLYTLAVVAALYGITRFRLPLEPLAAWMVAVALADPRGALQALQGSRWRGAAAAGCALAVGFLSLRYALTGWPGLYR